MAKQTLESGTRVTEKYGNFGVRGFDEITDPAFMFVEIIGQGGVGKTSLLRDHEGALIFNADCHPIPKPAPDTPPAKCAFFPVKNGSGHLLINGKRGPQRIPKVTWQLFLDEQIRIFAAVDAGRPHPQTVALDSVAAFLPLVRQHLLEHKPRFQKYDTIDEIPDGKPSMAFFGGAYDALALFCAEFLTHGIGVYLIGHRILKTLRNEGGETLITTTNIPEPLNTRYFQFLDMMFEVEKETYSFRGDDGKAHSASRRIITEPPPAARGKFRARVHIPLPFEIPAVGAWSAFRNLCISQSGDTVSQEVT